MKSLILFIMLILIVVVDLIAQDNKLFSDREFDFLIAFILGALLASMDSIKGFTIHFYKRWPFIMIS